MHEHSSSHTGIAAGPLLALMTQQAEAERAGIVSQAEVEAARIVAQARDEANAARERALRTAEAELTAAAQRGRERAEAEAHMLVLTTKDTVASEILGAVQAELARVAAGPGFGAVLEQLLAEVLDGADNDIVVLAPPAHAAAVRSWLEANGRAALAVEEAPFLKDGVAIRDAARTYRVTNTLTTRFERLESALRRQAIESLFGGGN